MRLGESHPTRSFLMTKSNTRGLFRRIRSGVQRGFFTDRGGSVHVMETMVVGIMVVGAVVAVSTMNAPVSDTEGFKTSQEHLVQDALDALAAQPSRDASKVIFGSLLEEYVMKAVAGQKSPLMDYLNRTLPSGSQYNVFLDTGFGRPVNVVSGGSPSAESQAGATSFVPKMSYVFMVPEFQSYQHDFHMNVLAIPMHNSLIQRDEGETIELKVTYTADGKQFTRTVSDRTALRFNDPDGRSWPSTSIYTLDGSGDPSHYLDASDMLPHIHSDEDSLIGTLLGVSLDTLDLSEVYNITIPLVVEESADHPIPRGAKLSMEIPRGWYLDPARMDWMRYSEELGNVDHWTDIEFNGTTGEGWTITARLKDPLRNGTAPFVFSGDYGMLVDSAYPDFQPIVTWMGDGAQGRSTILLDTPQLLDIGGYRRDAFISLAKPMISGQPATWGMNFANIADALGGSVTIDKVELKHPEGHRIFSTVDHLAGWAHGEWSIEGSGHAVWTPTGDSGVAAGDAAWLSMRVVGGPTSDNHYRSHDYQELLFNYSPSFTTGSGHDNWTFTKRTHHMGTDSVFRQLVPPAEGGEEWPGWPDEAGSYWFTADAHQRNRHAIGNATYDVSTTSVLAQAFGDYQGDHVYSKIGLEDPYGEVRRNFEVGERVHVKNDFSALFNSLTNIRDSTGIFDSLDIQNVHMTTSVFTPEKAWTGDPTKVFREAVNLDATFGQFDWMFPTDITDNNIQDLVLVGSDGLVYALDGRDGSRLWKIDSFKSVEQATLSDVTGDGREELVIASAGNALFAYDLKLNTDSKKRMLWTLSLPTTILDGGVPPHEVSALLDISSGETGDDPVLAVAFSATTGASYVALVHTEQESGGWSASLGATHKSAASSSLQNVRITDIVAAARPTSGSDPEMALAVSSMNRTVTMLSVPDMTPIWVTKTPERPLSLNAGDLSGDGYEDIIVNTGVTTTTASGGDMLYVLPGSTGTLGPAVRDLGMPSELEIRPRSAAITDQGHAVVAGDYTDLLQDATGFYDANVDALPIGSCEIQVGTSVTISVHGVLQELDDVYEWLQLRDWVGTFVESTPGGDTIYIIARDGSILRTVGACDANRFQWEIVDASSLLETVDSDGRYIDLHAHRPHEADGTLHRMTWDGTVERRVGGDGEWTLVADLCDESALGLCSDEMEVADWQVEEDEAGDAKRIWAAGRTAQITGGDVVWNGFVVSTDVGDLMDDGVTDPWSLEAQWEDVGLSAMHMGPDGRIWVGGGRADDSLFMAYRDGHDGSFVEQQIFEGAGSKGGYDFDLVLKFNYTTAPRHTVLDIAVASDGTAWALDPQGQVWRHAADGHWVLYPTRSGPTTAGALAADPEGTVWAFFDDYRHMPLHTHTPKAQLDLGSFSGGSSSTSLSVELSVDEGHLKQHPDDGEPITGLSWYARPASGGSWTKLEPTPFNLGVDYAATITSDSSFNNVVVRLEMESRTLSSGAEISQDAGMSPLLRDATVTVGSNTHSLNLQSIAGSSPDTTYSSYYEGIILAIEEPSWGYRGVRNLDSELHQGVSVRHVGLGAMTNSTSTMDVGLVERGNHNLQWWVVDGQTGVPVRPTSGTETVSSNMRYVDHLLVGDLTGDGIDNMATLGHFDEGNDMEYLGYIWDTQNEQWHFINASEDLIVPSAALTGPDRGRQTVTYALPEKTITAGVDAFGLTAGEKAHFVESWFGPLGDTEPRERWSTAPLASQGFTTFNYEIPRNALFGTAVVMSELTFDVISDNHSLTQTARLVEWFDILPPGRGESVPPVYTVEVVSWFDEGSGRSDRSAADDGTGEPGGRFSIDPDFDVVT